MDGVASRILFSTIEPAYAVNREGIIIAWNPAAERVFGHAESEAKGRHCWEFLAGQDLNNNRYCCRGCPLLETAFCHESVKDGAMLLRTASRVLKKFDVSTLLVSDGSGSELLVHLCRPQCEAAASHPAATGASRPSADDRHVGLTMREIEVLILLAQGKGTKELASELDISPATVRNHTQHILARLHVHNRVAAINVGRKLGLI